MDAPNEALEVLGTEQDAQIQEGDEKEQEKRKQAEWDSAKQEADQYKANYEKTVRENAVLAQQLEEQQKKVEEIERQISSRKAEDDFPELDPLMIDGNLIKSLTQLRTELKKANEEISGLKLKANVYEKSFKEKEAETYKEGVISRICKPLDEEFGAKHRNAARQMAEKLVETGKEKVPADALDAASLLRKCYVEVSKTKKESVRTDTGEGGSLKTPPKTRKLGTLEEVIADMKKDTSWKEEPVGEPGGDFL